MSLSALICEQLLPIQRWTIEIIDTILLQGDAMQRSAICKGNISANSSLSILGLPNIASFLVGEHALVFEPLIQSLGTGQLRLGTSFWLDCLRKMSDVFI